jgi:hypothetical protein
MNLIKRGRIDMAGFIGIVTDPGTWLLATIVIENIFIVILYRHWRAGAGFSLIRLLSCVALSIVLAVATFVIMVLLSRNTFKESKIDVTPIAGLSNEQISRFEEALNQFADFDSIVSFSVDKDQNAGSNISHRYRIFWSRSDPLSGLNISVDIYKDEQRAIEDFQSAVNNLNENQDGHYKYVVYDNNTEALLPDSKMITGLDALYFPNSERHISGAIRIGNARIALAEIQKYYNLEKNVSSDFIKLLCEML